MIEQNLARLWERAVSRKTPWDAAAARAALRELGFNPYAPPPEFAVKASLESGRPEPVSLPAGCASPGEPEADPSTTSWPRCGPATPSVPPSEIEEDCAGARGGILGQSQDDGIQDAHPDGAALTGATAARETRYRH